VTPRRLRLTLVILLALVVLIAVGVYFMNRLTVVVDAPPPQRIPETVDTLPPLPLSVVEAPVTYDLDTAIDSLEAAVPRTYGDLDQKIETVKNDRVKFAYLLHRSPFRVKVTGQTVSISADIEYSGRVWYDSPVGPELELACGTGEDLPRRATLTIESTGALTREWGLRTKSRVVRLAAYSDSARDRCRLTFLRIDVTDRVLETTHQLLEEKLALFDEAVARWPVRPRFEKVWRDLQAPLWLSDSVYMTINPSQAQVGSIGASGKTAFANLRLVAAPRVTTGHRPKIELIPLPPLELAGDVKRGARVLLDASFTYPVATAMLRKALIGRSLEQGGHRIRIADIRIFGLGGGKVALGVRVAGAVRGRLFFTGTPGYDLKARQVIVPDLEYDVGTAQILVQGYEWLNDANLRDFLRERARIPDSAVVHTLCKLAEQGMNRDLPARGTHLSGRIDQAGVIAVSATLEDIRVRALADADLKLSIDRAPSIPRPPETGQRREYWEDAERK
jgi:Domain of unknown function (DUF4403)